MNIANALTVSRLLLAPVILFLGYVLRDQPYLLVAVIVIVALTDFVDGWVARSFSQASRLGEFLDPLSDKVMAICTYLAAVLWFGFAWYWALLVLLRDIVVAAAVVWHVLSKKSWQGSVTRARWTGKLTTVLQQLTVIGAILRVPFLVALVLLTGTVGIAALADYWRVSHAR